MRTLRTTPTRLIIQALLALTVCVIAAPALAYDSYDERREERHDERREEHKKRLAERCNADWNGCSAVCEQRTSGERFTYCMVDCNNNLNQCMLDK